MVQLKLVILDSLDGGPYEFKTRAITNETLRESST